MQVLSNKENIKQIMRFLRHFRGIVILIIVVGIGASLAESVGITLVFPLLEGGNYTQNAPLPFPFNQISAHFSGMGLKQRVQIVAMLMVIIIALKSLLTYVGNRLINSLRQGSIKHYRMLCFEQLMRFKMGYFNEQRLGHIQSLIVTNASYVGVLISGSANIIINLFTILFLVVMLFLLSWKMTLLAIVLVGVSSLALRYLNHISTIAGKASSIAIQNMNSTLLDVLTGMKIIHLFNRENDMVSKFDRDAEKCRKTLFNLFQAMDLTKPLFEFIGVTSLALVLIAGSLLLGNYGNSSLGVILIFLFIFFRIMPSANALNAMRVSIAGNWPFLTSIHEFIQQNDELYINSGVKVFTGLKRGIEVRGVNFSYSAFEALVLRDVSFSISKGLKIGIAGPSGGGKSTIVELLLRFYDPQKGQILIDDIDLREFDINSWRRHIGVVSQDTFLFNDTVWANIAFAKPEASREEIEKAVRRAHAHNFIKELPQDFDTLLGERGVRLSGGQKQRIAIARAILAEPEILIFDEATSALDTGHERIVQEAMDGISKGKTVITIAHRFSTIYDSDVILVLDSGKIIQQGTHEELLRQEGLYAKLVQMQVMKQENKECAPIRGVFK